jgi:hypothetical protein
MTVISTSKFAAVDWKAPVLPAPNGLFAAVNWAEEDVPRWFDSGVLVERTNFDHDTGYGLWTPDWNATAAEVVSSTETKDGDRPERDDTPFVHSTAFAYARNPCGDLREVTRQETDERAQNTLTRTEQKTVETDFGARLAADITAESITAGAAADVIEAVSQLEIEISDQGVNAAIIHANPKWAAYLVAARLVQLRADGWHSPLGHLFVFGAGYIDALDDTLVATTPVYGWRTPVTPFDTIDHETNTYIRIVERSTLLAYEQVLSSTEITLP